MRILLISSSPRKKRSQTFLLASEVLKGLPKKGAKTEMVHLCDLRIGFCRHCESCHKNPISCPVKDDVRPLLNKMLESDGIIFASPVYIHQVTGYLKMFLDRSSHFIHCQRLLGKYVVAVATSGGGPQKQVLDYIKEYALTCGAQFVGGISTKVPVTGYIKTKAKALGRRLAEAIKNKKEFSAQISSIRKRREYFGKIIQLRKDIWPAEYQYWKDRSWL